MVQIPDPRRILGEIPVGDAAEMRRKAAALDRDAELVGHLARQVAARVHGTRFEGPAARRFQQDLNWVQRELETQARHIRELAEDLRRTAGRVEGAQDSWRRRFAQLEREARELARKAAEKASGR